MTIRKTAPLPPPYLTADILYCRPVARRALLGLVADLGIFVRERAMLGRVYGNAPDQGAELLVAFVTGSGRDLALVRSASRAGKAVVAIVPPGDVESALGCREFAAVADESDGDEALRQAIQRAAKLARLGRIDRGDYAPATTVFAHLELHHAPPALSRGNKTILLSAVEYQLLAALVAARGEALTSTRIVVEIKGADAVVSQSYVKSAILRVRRKAEILGGDADALRNVRGLGYVLSG